MKDYGPGVACSRRFPRPCTEETVVDELSYPAYRRRANSFSVSSKHPSNRRERFTVGNEWVVPYNPYLSRKYKAHINVEVCGTVPSAPLDIFTNIFTRAPTGDRATMELDSMDEIKQYRYLGSSEGIWRLYEFAIHGERPPVLQLPFHLPNQHFISFDCAAPSDDVMVMETILDKRFSSTMLDILRFTWDSSGQEWNPRLRGFQIGRMYQGNRNPFQGEIYYPRCLLTVVPGANVPVCHFL
jgi:hypothetical protein